MRLYEDFQRYRPFREPNWRWERVLKIADRFPTAGRCSRRDDAFIRQARSFLLRWRDRNTTEDREDLFWENPGLFYAYEIHTRRNDEPELPCYLQARLLANQTYEEIAEMLSTIPETVMWYEALFFNVADRLHNRDWITKHVLTDAFMRFHPSATPDAANPAVTNPAVALPFLDATLKLFAYFGGTHLVDIMISGFQQGKMLITPDDMPKWFDNQWSTTIRKRSTQAAMTVEINKYNCVELFAVHARIMELEKSDDASATQRSSTERHIKSFIDELPWSVGAAGAKKHAGTSLAVYDDCAAELRDDELLAVASNKPPEGLADKVTPLQLPAPRTKGPINLGRDTTEDI